MYINSNTKISYIDTSHHTLLGYRPPSFNN